MSNYSIKVVKSRRDLRRFIKFPDRLYRGCPQYVPALHSDQVKSLTRVSTLSYCQHELWLVEDERGQVVGRISAMVNPRYNERYHTRRARFGWFDTINDIEVARLLLSTAEAWAREQGMTEVHGPLYYNTLGKQGMLVEGFDHIPPFNCLYNYSYYNDLITALGYTKECDWVQYRVDPGYLPEKTNRVADIVRQRYNLHLGSLDELKKDSTQVRKFFEVYSSSFAETVYNFIPFTEEEMDEEADSIIGFVSDKVSAIVMDEHDEVAAFGIVMPSISKALQKAKGRLLPFGWFHILRAMHHYEVCDMMLNGAAPQWQNKGVSAVYISDIFQKFQRVGLRDAITNPQIETNSAINIWNSYKHELYMRRRCYIKNLDKK